MGFVEVVFWKSLEFDQSRERSEFRELSELGWNWVAFDEFKEFRG